MATANLLQTSVSGGTQNALSLQGDGVFFPKASTASRLALTLTTTDKGLIVYDTTDNNIYFWNGAAWESVPSSGDAGANGSVQYNDNGIVSGATNFVWDKVNGRVGIGTASPARPLDIVGSFQSSFGWALVGSPAGLGGTTRYIGGAGGTDSWYFNALTGGNHLWAFGEVEAMRLNSTSNLVLKGGTAGANGVGLTFPATQVASSDANCLDDYEEGTFTPTIIGTTTAGVGTYTFQNGKYTKVGNLVTCYLYLAWTAHTGTGDMRIGGLPFATASAGGIYYAASIGYATNIALTAGYVLTGYALDISSTAISLQQYPTGGGASLSVPIDVSGGIIVSVSYTV